MNPLDVRTVLVGSIISNGICAMVLGSLWYKHRGRFQGISLWFASSLVFVVSLILLSLRGSIPDFFSIFLSNAGIIAGLFILYLGVESHFELKSARSIDIVLLSAFAASYGFSSLGEPDLRIRTIELSAAMAYILFKCTAIFLGRVEEADRKIAWNAGVVFLFAFILSVVRVVLYLFANPGNDFMRTDALAANGLLAYQMVFIAITFSLVHIVAKELELKLEEDIEKRLEAEKEAKFNEEKFSSAFQNMPDGLALTRISDGTIFEANSAFSEMFGYDKEEITGKTTIELGIWTTKALRDRFREEFNSTGRVKHIYLDFHRKSGEIFPGYFSAEKMQLRQEPCLLSIFHDMTESKETENALARSEILLNEVQNVSHIGGWEYEVATSRLTWTDEVYRIHEVSRDYDPNDIKGNIAFYADSDRERIDEAFERAVIVGEPYDLELRFVTAKGNRRLVRTIGQPQYENGHVVRIVGNIADITEQRKLDEERRRMAGVLEKSLNEIYMFDPKTYRFIYANPSALKNVGYSLQELKGMTPVDLKADLTDENFRALVRPLLAGEKQRVVFESAHTRKDKTRYPVEVFLQLIGDSDVPVFLAIINDISERKKMEEVIRSLNVDLEERVKRRTAELLAANKELEAFSYSVSHDLRAPLRSIDGFSKAFLDDFGGIIPKDGRAYLERIRKASQKMGSLIDSMLLLSRVTRDEMKLETVDLSALAEKVMADLEQANRDKKISVRIDPGMTAVGDKRLLRILLDNLFGNAWKFTVHTENAEIKFHESSDDEHGVFFTISDNGAGFDPKYKDKLFTAFQRLHGQDEFPGTGVGLAIVQRVVRRHGGEVWADGAIGKGADFSFSIPDMTSKENDHFARR
jgi:PAS domain S-box-containing protein